MLVAALLPIGCAGLAKWGMVAVSRREGGYDNHHPRAWLARQSDWRARANAAQANSFEALPLFIGAVIIAHQLGAHQTRLDLLAFLFVALRLGVAIALVVAVTVEIAANPNGMGYAMMIAQQSMEPARMLAWLFWIGVVGMLINVLTLRAQRWVHVRMGGMAQNNTRGTP